MFNVTHFTSLPIGFDMIEGGTTATERTVTGIEKSDELLLVKSFVADGTTGAITVVDLTSEFAITDKGKIQNAGGTATTDEGLVIVWHKKHPAGL